MSKNKTIKIGILVLLIVVLVGALIHYNNIRKIDLVPDGMLPVRINVNEEEIVSPISIASVLYVLSQFDATWTMTKARPDNIGDSNHDGKLDGYSYNIDYVMKNSKQESMHLEILVKEGGSEVLVRDTFSDRCYLVEDGASLEKKLNMIFGE